MIFVCWLFNFHYFIEEFQKVNCRFVISLLLNELHIHVSVNEIIFEILNVRVLHSTIKFCSQNILFNYLFCLIRINLKLLDCLNNSLLAFLDKLYYRLSPIIDFMFDLSNDSVKKLEWNQIIISNLNLIKRLIRKFSGFFS
jgi:hypothetical protein